MAPSFKARTKLNYLSEERGPPHYFLGKHYRLKLVDVDPAGPPTPTVRIDGDRMLFRREQVAAGEKRIAEHYMRAARPYLNNTVQRWKKIVGVEPAKYVQVMDLGFRWASCSSEGTLNFHWRIMQLPPPVIDYVAVHELTHLKAPCVREVAARIGSRPRGRRFRKVGPIRTSVQGPDRRAVIGAGEFGG
jgi:predicted metal-dependent hydrolase